MGVRQARIARFDRHRNPCRGAVPVVFADYRAHCLTDILNREVNSPDSCHLGEALAEAVQGDDEKCRADGGQREKFRPDHLKAGGAK